MTHSSWRTAALTALTRVAFEVFRRSPMIVRRHLIRLLTPNYTVGAVAVCEDESGAVLLVHSRQHAGWGLPGGLLRRGEEPITGLARELAEELSIVVDPEHLTSARTHTVVDPDAQQVTVVFAVTLDTPPEVDGIEVMAARWFTPAELPATLVRGTYESLEAMGAVDFRAVR